MQALWDAYIEERTRYHEKEKAKGEKWNPTLWGAWRICQVGVEDRVDSERTLLSSACEKRETW